MATANGLGKGVLLKPDPIADTFRNEVKDAIAQCTRPPTLVGILGTTSAPSKFYADFTRKQCEQLGVRFVLKEVGSAASSEQADGEGVEEAIVEANEDPDVDGIMVRVVWSSLSGSWFTWEPRCTTLFSVHNRYVILVSTSTVV